MSQAKVLRGSIILAILCLTANLTHGQAFKPTHDNAYFPFDLYNSENDFGKVQVDSFRLGYHSLMLRQFGEPKLYNSTDPRTIYRFTWLRSFDLPMTTSLIVKHDKIILQTKVGNKINIDNSHFDLTRLTRKETERFYQYTSGKLDSLSITDLFKKGIWVKDTVRFKYATKMKVLSTEVYQEFEHLIDKAQFWTYPPMGKANFGTDGADWILEAHDADKGYHMVYRWSPTKDRDSEFRELCAYLIILTETTRKNRIY